MTTPHIAAINRYPVKGFNADVLESADIRAGECLALDRAYAVEAGSGKFDPVAPQHLPKVNFLMLMRHERLATLEARFEEEGHVLTLLRDGRQVARGSLQQKIGRQIIEQFLAAYMGEELRGAPRIVHADNHHFTDVPSKSLSLLNLASVRDLERVTGRPVDPGRFRANLHVDGLDPWVEFDWLDKTIEIGGAPLVEVRARIDRCAATDVDPATGARDMTIPRSLTSGFGHHDMGVYVAAIADGTIKLDDELKLAGT